MEKILGIHIDAPAKVGRAITGARKHVGRYFGSQEFTPHITLYLARYSVSSFRLLVKQLTQLPPPSREVIIGGFVVDSLSVSQKFLRIKVRRTKSFMSLHRLLVRRANLLREGLLRSKDRRSIQEGEYSAAETRRILKYGYSRVMSNFNPHFTIGVLDRQPSAAASEKAVRRGLESIRGYSWVPDYIVVGLYDNDTKLGRYTERSEEHMIRLPGLKAKSQAKLH